MKILLCGVPASGKSTFGKEIAQSHGYLHIDAEQWPNDRLHTLWDEVAYDLSLMKTFVKMAGENVIFDWGFPFSSFAVGMIVEMKLYGYKPYWFDCPITLARKRYINRPYGDIADFDRQVVMIRKNQLTIKEIIKPQNINVLLNNKQKTADQLFAEIKRRSKTA